MNPTNRSLEEILFESAVEKPLAADRAAFLDHACRGNPVLRAALDELLESHFGAVGFLPHTAPHDEWFPARDSVPTFAEATAQMLGRYKLLEKIGEGGFGEVWMAEQRSPVKRRVALKIIKPGMDSRQVVARFEAERQALAMMDHPGIARIFDADVTGAGRPYFVMELVRGIKITDYCDQNKFPTRERLRLFIRICQAVQHAHQKGIIHRDLKPSNILVTVNDGVAVPKVIDFGIAKATQGELTDKTVFTQFQQFVGTPAYISPEQAEMSSLDIDTRADIYSLGVLLYELLVGQTPFDANEMMNGGLDALRQIIREREPLRPSTRLNTLPGDDLTTAGQCRQTEAGKLVHQLKGDLDWIVLKCLEKDRARRYETANGLAADIQRHLDNEPITARPPSTAYRIRKLIRRNRLAFTAAALVGLALVLGVIGVMLVQYRANQEYRRRLYVSEVNRAGLAWQGGQSVGLRESLERCPAGLRGWEWNFLHQQVDRWEATEVLPTGGLTWSGVSVDGNLAAVSAGDVIRIREFPDGRWLRDIPHAATWKSPFAVSPRGERLAALVDGAATITVWNMRTGERVSELKEGGPAGMFSWSADGRRVACGCGDGMIRLWDAASGKVEKSLPSSANPAQVALSPDDRTLAVLPGGGTTLSGGSIVQLLDSGTGTVMRTLRSRAGSFMGMKFSPDSRKLATYSSNFGGSTRDNRVWDLEDAEAGSLDLMTGAAVVGYDFSPDSRQVLAAEASGMIRLWDLERRTEVDRFAAHAGTALSVQWLPDRWILSSGGDGARVWRARHPGALEFPVHPMSLRCVAFSPDSRRLAAAGTAALVSVLDLAGSRPAQNYTDSPGTVYSVAIRHDGMVASAGMDAVELWDPVSFEKKWRYVLAPAPSVYWIAFSPDGSRLYVASHADMLSVLDAATGKQLRSISGLGKTLDGLAVSPDGRLLALCQKSDQEKLSVRSADDLHELWHAPSFTERCAAFSPDGKWIATGDRDGAVSLWEVAAEGRVRRKMRGHAATVTGVNFHPDGSRLVSCSFDGSVKVWDWKTDTDLLTLPLPGGGQAWHVAWSPDGSTIAAAGEQGMVTVWRVE
jgi:serine/threonine protein kinase/WD40 repeat protein